MADSIRPAVLSGQWYPDTPSACTQFFSETPELPGDNRPSQAVAAIVPHAGWVYSGAIAFQAMTALKQQQAEADLIVVFGGHLGPRDSPRLFMAGAWETPFGTLETPIALAQDIAMAIECDLETMDAYSEDNATEVLMPMIKHLWADAEVLVLGIPPNDRAVGLGHEVLDLAKRRGYKRILIIGSTDMTHYGPNYNFQPKGRGHTGLAWVKEDNDPMLIEHIEAMQLQKVMWVATRHRNACCPGAINATLAASRDLGATRAKLTQYTTSYDVRPDGQPTSFVGYAGFLIGR